jgi:hypothetical protein
MKEERIDLIAMVELKNRAIINCDSTSVLKDSAIVGQRKIIINLDKQNEKLDRSLSLQTGLTNIALHKLRSANIKVVALGSLTVTAVATAVFFIFKK